MAILTRNTVFYLYFLFFSLCIMAPRSVYSENLILPENKIKAGLLYNFLKYTQWPDTIGASINLCVFGNDPFDGLLQPISERTVNQKNISLQFINDIQKTANCQLVFINNDERGQWPELKKFLTDKSVLTVSDFASFANEGGMIEFNKKGGRIQAELNMNALNAAKMQVQDSMLKLVTIME